MRLNIYTYRDDVYRDFDLPLNEEDLEVTSNKWSYETDIIKVINANKWQDIIDPNGCLVEQEEFITLKQAINEANRSLLGYSLAIEDKDLDLLF